MAAQNTAQMMIRAVFIQSLPWYVQRFPSAFPILPALIHAYRSFSCTA
jgi:hypothetical protein